MHDAARDLAKQITGAADPARTPTGTVPAGAPADPAAQTAPQDPAPTSGADPYTTIQTILESAGDQGRQAFAQFNQWVEHISGERQRMAAIAQNPAFIAALEHVRAEQLSAAGATPTNGRRPAAGGDDLVAKLAGMKDEEFETPTEKSLRDFALNLAQQNQAIAEQLNELRAGHDEVTRFADRQELEAFNSHISAIHAEIDLHFPELAKDRAKYMQWHKMADRLWDPKSGPQGLKSALVLAGQALNYPTAQRNGAKTALDAARRGARASSARDAGHGAETDTLRPGESLTEFAERRIAAA
jgi:hypothetical protein